MLWEVLSFYNDPIILPGPKIVLQTLFTILNTKETYMTLFTSLFRVIAGLLISFVIGIPVGVILALNKNFKIFLMPLIKFLQSTPIISWILLALIWLKLWMIPIFILFLNSFPIIVINVYEGFLGVDTKLIEMSDFYKVSISKKIRNLYVPSIVSNILASTTIILSSSFKVIVMAEVISKIDVGIGSNINYAWINIETEKILAWTIIVVLLGLTIEKLINGILRKKLGRYYA